MENINKGETVSDGLISKVQWPYLTKLTITLEKEGKE
jgi:hypothetical protein